MCAVSMVLQYGQRVWDGTPVEWIGTIPDPTPAAERDAIRRFMELVDAAKRFDAAADEPDCEDPGKADFLAGLNDRLKRIEAALGITA